MVDSTLLEKYKFTKAGKPDMETAEEHLGVFTTTGYPSPIFRKKIVFEAINTYVEEAYFWMIDHLRHDWSFTTFEKITDVFAASAQSAFFGVSEQRLAIQQDKAAQYLKGISEMVKALFQIVRELRIIDERLQYYNDTFGKYARKVGEQKARGAEITLKGIWVDQVEGGVKNAGSVYGLAQTVGFTILPDLFFRVEIEETTMDKMVDDFETYNTESMKAPEKINKKVDNMTEFNEKVREVLKRKLTQYYIWKHRTYKELCTRRKFTIKYLRQHYDTISLYLGWIKPYLRNIKKLQLDEKRIDSAELISAFEGSMVEIEVLAIRKDQRSYKKYFPCILVHFLYRTKPSMTYMAEGYQRGPAHTGKYEMTLRSYIWSEDQIHNYKQMKDEENLELLSSINESIKEATEALGKDLKDYLLQGGEKFEKEKKEEKKKRNWDAIDPFTSVFGGFKEIFSPLITLPELRGKKKGPSALEIADEKAAIRVFLRTATYQSYKNFKKAHKFIQW